MEDFNPFTFEGRMGRAQYFWFGLIWGCIYFVLSRAVGATGSAPTHVGAGSGLIAILVGIICIIATFSYGIRRLHDFDRSGWWYVLVFVPVVNLVLALILLFTPGTPGANSHGVRS